MKTKTLSFISSVLLTAVSLTACTIVPDDDIITGGTAVEYDYYNAGADDRLEPSGLPTAKGSAEKSTQVTAVDGTARPKEHVPPAGPSEDGIASDDQSGPSDAAPQNNKPDSRSIDPDPENTASSHASDSPTAAQDSGASKPQPHTKTVADPPTDSTGPEKAEDRALADNTAGPKDPPEEVVVDLPDSETRPAEIKEEASTLLTVPTVDVEGNTVLVNPERRRKRPWTVYWKP